VVGGDETNRPCGLGIFENSNIDPISTDPDLQEIQSLDNKIHETVETINTMKIQREFFLSFAKEPQLFINKWIISQSRGASGFLLAGTNVIQIADFKSFGGNI
jgi:hypothetical protein